MPTTGKRVDLSKVNVFGAHSKDDAATLARFLRRVSGPRGDIASVRFFTEVDDTSEFGTRRHPGLYANVMYTEYDWAEFYRPNSADDWRLFLYGHWAF